MRRLAIVALALLSCTRPASYTETLRGGQTLVHGHVPTAEEEYYAPQAMLGGCSSTWSTTGSLYRSKCTHAGARPASDAIGDWAVTVQISSDWPAPCAATDGGSHRPLLP